MQRLLLTGAGGFLGRNCLDALAASDWEVHAADLQEAGPRAFDGVWHSVDLLEEGAAERLIEKTRPTHLLHLAWTGARPVYSSPENSRWLAASRTLFSCFAAAAGRRIVGIGSSAEYDWSGGLCREDETPLAPETAYGKAKAELGAALDDLRRAGDVGAVWARPFFLFGRYENPARFVAAVITGLLQGEAVRTTHGRQVRDYLYAGDAAEALVHLLTSDFDGALNVASGEPIALADLALEIARRLDREELLELGALAAPPNEAPRVVADVRRLREEVGWVPRRSRAIGLEETIDWWRSELSRTPPRGKDERT